MSPKKISDIFEQTFLSMTNDTIRFSDIIDALHERGFGFVLFIVALPMALPIPVPPGVNILLASPLIILTAQQAVGRHTIWLPKKIMSRSISREKFQGMITKCIPWVKKIEYFVRPRLGFITHGIFSHLIGLMGLIMALSVMTPLPLTNTVPSLGIALMAVGVIMRDGLAVIAGAIIGLAWVSALVYFAILFGTEGIDMMKEAIKSFL